MPDSRYTERQGDYLSFIHCYTRVNAPAASGD